MSAQRAAAVVPVWLQYRARAAAIPIAPELPLYAGVIDPLPGLSLAGGLRVGALDAWGQ